MVQWRTKVHSVSNKACNILLLSYLFDLNDTDFRLDFENRCRGIPGDASGPLSGKNLSEVVNNIVWVRQLELKVLVLM